MKGPAGGAKVNTSQALRARSDLVLTWACSFHDGPRRGVLVLERHLDNPANRVEHDGVSTRRRHGPLRDLEGSWPPLRADAVSRSATAPARFR